MLVNNHKTRLDSRHDILSFILIMNRRLVFYNRNRGCDVFIRRIGTVKQILFLLSMLNAGIQLHPVCRNRFVVGRRTRIRLKRIIFRAIIYLRCRHIRCPWIENGNIGFTLCIELNGRNIIELTDCFLHGCSQYLPDSLFILKFDFRFGGMDVNVYILGLHFQIDEIGHLLTYRNQTFKSTLHRLVEIRMLHITAIRKEELMGTLFLGRFRFPHKSCNLTNGSLHLNRKNILIKAFAKNINDTLAEIALTEIEHLYPIAMQGEMYLRIHEDDTFKSLKDIVEFRGIRLQELPPCRYIIEKILHREITSYRTGNWSLRRDLATRNSNLRTYFIGCHPRLQYNLSHSGNRGKCLTTESHCVKSEKVVCLAYLGCSVTLERKASICFRHSFSIVYDLNRGSSGINHNDVDSIGVGIHGILDQFLDDTGRTLNHLTSCYLVGNAIRQYLYDITHYSLYPPALVLPALSASKTATGLPFS